MAKTTPFPPGYAFSDEQKLAIFNLRGKRKILFLEGSYGTYTFARLQKEWRKTDPLKAAFFEQRLRDAGAAWDRLKFWKRVRWSLCAAHIWATLPHLADSQPLSGRALYQGEFLTQETEPGKQPISPCSRRATDPAASPWDWTP